MDSIVTFNAGGIDCNRIHFWHMLTNGDVIAECNGPQSEEEAVHHIPPIEM